jgi:hypothetical protein
MPNFQGSGPEGQYEAGEAEIWNRRTAESMAIPAQAFLIKGA